MAYQKPPTIDGEAREKIAHLNNIMIGVVIVVTALILSLVFTLGGIVNNYLAEKTATYLNLVERVNKNIQEVDALRDEIKELRDFYLKNQTNAPVTPAQKNQSIK